MFKDNFRSFDTIRLSEDTYVCRVCGRTDEDKLHFEKCEKCERYACDACGLFYYKSDEELQGKLKDGITDGMRSIFGIEFFNNLNEFNYNYVALDTKHLAIVIRMLFQYCKYMKKDPKERIMYILRNLEDIVIGSNVVFVMIPRKFCCLTCYRTMNPSIYMHVNDLINELWFNHKDLYDKLINDKETYGSAD